VTQLLAHLAGDYVLQSHVMATRKTSSWAWAYIHAFFYTLPFLLLTQDPRSLVIILCSHALIDRYRLAAYWCRWWGVGFPGLWWRTTCMAGHPIKGDEPLCRTGGCAAPPSRKWAPPPPFLGVWLIIIVDNTMHLCVNYAALSW
jgi:hypothetical protein